MISSSEAGRDASAAGCRLAAEATNLACRRWSRWALALALGAALGGCVTVKAPSGPIVVQLDVNIKQEVVYRLAADAGNTIKQNPEIF